MAMTSNHANSLAGKWAVVTGSSSGIGRAIATEFATAGANVVVHGNRRQAEATLLADELRKYGGKVETIFCDLSATMPREGFVDQCWHIAPVDFWVNNAGADVLTGAAADWPFAKKLETLWHLDVVATIELSRAVGEKMKSRGAGVILNMGWDQADTGMDGESGELFATAKGAVMAFSRSLAKSLAPEVRVNCLAPGWIRTAWAETASEYWQERAQRESLQQRWGTPEDVSRAARFLASEEAAFITGQVLPINGGRP